MLRPPPTKPQLCQYAPEFGMRDSLTQQITEFDRLLLEFLGLGAGEWSSGGHGKLDCLCESLTKADVTLLRWTISTLRCREVVLTGYGKPGVRFRARSFPYDADKGWWMFD